MALCMEMSDMGAKVDTDCQSIGSEAKMYLTNAVSPMRTLAVSPKLREC